MHPTLLVSRHGGNDPVASLRTDSVHDYGWFVTFVAPLPFEPQSDAIFFTQRITHLDGPEEIWELADVAQSVPGGPHQYRARWRRRRFDLEARRDSAPPMPFEVAAF